VNFAFELVLYESGPRGSLYTFHHRNRDLSELDRFLDDEEVQQNPDFNRLVQRLTEGVDNPRRFRRQWFRNEGPVQALFAPYPREEKEALDTPYPPALRLYCVRRLDLVIAGYGGVKTTRTYQEDSRLHQAVKELTYVDGRLQDRLDMGFVWFEDAERILGGNLEFE
jgi:hypothetical protein